MKKGIHPQYNKSVTVTCACGNTFQTGATVSSIHVELCHKCHPFYTGKQRIVDTENLVKKFEAKQKAASSSDLVTRKKKKLERSTKVTSLKAEKKLTLKDMLEKLKK